MNRIRLFLLFLIFNSSSFAQGIIDTRINLYGAYVFKDRLNEYVDAQNYFNGTINGGAQWGLGFEVMMNSGSSYELAYIRQDTRAPLNYWSNGQQFKNFDVSVNYLTVGRNKHFILDNEFLEAYIGTDVGGMMINVKNPAPGAQSSILKPAWGFRAGVNLWTHDRIAVKLNARLLSGIQAIGGGVYFGTGGLGGAVSPFSSIYQISMSGGLSFRL